MKNIYFIINILFCITVFSGCQQLTEDQITNSGQYSELTSFSTVNSDETYAAYSESDSTTGISNQLSTTEKKNSEHIVTTVSESNVSFSSKTEFSSKTTEYTSTDTEVYDEEPVIVYGTDYDRVDDGFEAASGEIYLSSELKNAMNEYSDNPLVTFAIYIDVYDYNDTHSSKTEEFLNNTVMDGFTYAQINEKRSEIDEEIKRLSEISDIYLNPDLTEEQVTEYSNRITELTNEDQYYYEISMDMLIAADRYLLQLESDRLEELGIDVCGITDNKRDTNYIIAIVSAEEINSMPFSDDVGYKIWLAPET